ncbi:TPA: hypothetical protein ACK3Q6_007663 [Burkholderia cepacia]
MSEQTKGMKGFGTGWQFCIGMWFSFGVTGGIWARSWSAFVGPVLVGLFFLFSIVSIDATRAAGTAIRRAGFVGATLSALAFTFAFSLGIERLYFVNASTYPQAFARDVGKITDPRQLDPIQKQVCGHTMMEIHSKKNGWFIRCGSLWYTGHTFYSSTDPYAAYRGQLQ